MERGAGATGRGASTASDDTAGDNLVLQELAAGASGGGAGYAALAIHAGGVDVAARDIKFVAWRSNSDPHTPLQHRFGDGGVAQRHGVAAVAGGVVADDDLVGIAVGQSFGVSTQVE